MNKYEFGEVAEDESLARQLAIDTTIIGYERPEEKDRKLLDVTVKRASSNTTIELKYDQKSHSTKNLYIECMYRGEPSGLLTTIVTLWQQTFIDGETVYCVEYPISILKGRVKGKSIVSSGNGSCGYLLPKSIVFKDIQSGAARLVFKDTKRQWIESLRKRGGSEIDEHLADLLEPKNERKKSMSERKLMVRDLVVHIRGDVLGVYDTDGSPVFVLEDMPANASASKPASVKKAKQVKRSGGSQTIQLHKTLDGSLVAGMIENELLGKELDLDVFNEHCRQKQSGTHANPQSFSSAIKMMRKGAFNVVEKDEKYVVMSKTTHTVSQPQSVGN